MHWNIGCKEPSTRNTTSPLAWTTQRQHAAIIWHAQRITGRQAWRPSPCEGRIIQIQHTNLRTYNTLAVHMGEVGATVAVFGDYHPRGQLCGRTTHHKYLQPTRHLTMFIVLCQYSNDDWTLLCKLSNDTFCAFKVILLALATI